MTTGNEDGRPMWIPSQSRRLACLVLVAVGWSASCHLSLQNLLAQEPNLRTLFDGHTGLVTSIAIAPDGNLVVSGSLDGTVKIWDLATDRERVTLVGHAGPVWSVWVMDDGETIGSRSQDGTVKLWDVATGTETRTVQGEGPGLASVTFSADGATQVLTAGSTVTLRNVATGEDRILRRPSRYNAVAAWGFTEDGKTLVVSSYMDEIVLWDTDTGKERLIIPDEHVLCVALAPDETTLAAGPGGGGGPVKLWDTATGDLLSTFSGHTARVWQVAFSPDGRMLASAG